MEKLFPSKAPTSIGVKIVLSKARDIKRRAEEAKLQGSVGMQADQKKMLNNELYSDVVFICADGKRVHASRHLLCARSVVFENMLTRGMLESTSSEISVPGISSSVLLSIFEFLYTSKLVDHIPTGWRNTAEALSAARFYRLEELERIVRAILIESLLSGPLHITTVVAYLNTSMEFPVLFEKDMDFIPKKIVGVFKSHAYLLEPKHFLKLSEGAFRYILFASTGKTVVEELKHESINGNPALSLEEYVKFRQIILWCTVRFSPALADSLRKYLPVVKTSALRLDEEKLKRFEWKADSIMGIRESISIFGKEMLQMIDIRQIHPQLLVKVIEPLGILSTEQLTAAFRFHVVQQAPSYYILDNSVYRVMNTSDMAEEDESESDDSGDDTGERDDEDDSLYISTTSSDDERDEEVKLR